MAPQIFLLLAISLSGIISTEGTISCPTPGFTLSTDSSICFAFNQNYKSSSHHSVMCQAYDAQLLTIEDAAKEALVVSYLGSIGETGSEIYIMGLTNILGSSTDWAWYRTAGSIGRTNWKSGFPVSTDKYNCAGFYAGTPDNKWENLYCLKDKRALCQKTPTDA